MIIYHHILDRLKAAGWTTYRLRKDGKLSESVIQSLRDERSITSDTIDKICDLLDCQPGDLMSYVKEVQKEGE